MHVAKNKRPSLCFQVHQPHYLLMLIQGRHLVVADKGIHCRREALYFPYWTQSPLVWTLTWIGGQIDLRRCEFLYKSAASGQFLLSEWAITSVIRGLKWSSVWPTDLKAILYFARLGIDLHVRLIRQRAWLLSGKLSLFLLVSVGFATASALPLFDLRTSTLGLFCLLEIVGFAYGSPAVQRLELMGC